MKQDVPHGPGLDQDVNTVYLVVDGGNHAVQAIAQVKLPVYLEAPDRLVDTYRLD